MQTFTTAIFPPPPLQEATDFGVMKSHKLIAIRSDQFNPHFLASIPKFYTNDYSTASVIDMSSNVNIGQYGYTHLFDWAFNVQGEDPVQAESKKQLLLRTNEQLSNVFGPSEIPPRVTWFNRIQELLIVKTGHVEMVYLVKDGEFQAHGRIEDHFNSVKCKQIRTTLRWFNPGEGFFCSLYPDRRGLVVNDGYSVFLLEKRENAIQLPEHVVVQVAMKVLVP